MDIISLVFLSIGLTMDAFAVSICKGLAIRKTNIKSMCICGLWFGAFQGLMPIIGYFLGSSFRQYIESFDHWVAFILLVLIGMGMIKEAFGKDEEANDALDVKTMFLLAVATSIDALAVGVSFAFLDTNIWTSSMMIGVITFIISALGVKIGNLFGSKYKSKAELAGGIILIIIGIKILLEHIGVI